MSLPEDPAALAAAAWRTWGARGLGRRGRYELVRRTGRLRRLEDAWPTAPPEGARLQRLGLSVPPSSSAGPVGSALVPPLVLYGALPLEGALPPDWHRHPITGVRLDPTRHWSELSDADPAAGDIKDIWEPARFGWLQRAVRASADQAPDDAQLTAEAVWRTIEDWVERNPRYRGPHWMCGQETSLRTISAMWLAEVLDASPATTDARRALIARLVHDAVGRVAPTLGYALSQRNNHASSEAGFLWSASVLAPWLPGAGRLRQRAADALAEVVEDQFAADGSYAQHSPTYQRVALHVLLWCLAVERATGAPAPSGVRDAVARSVPFLRSLMAPGGEGRVPNLGGNDGALVFDLVDTPIGDLRPVVAHAAAATGQASGLGAGPWDREAAWFGLPPSAGLVRPAPSTGTTHPLTRGRAHAVVRAGALSHRPAHADQLHVDVWLGGVPVAVDPGSYRYTAPPPWGNALAGDDVHNLPRHPEIPQAVRAGRFFWRSWREAAVRRRIGSSEGEALVAVLDLPGGLRLRRLVAVGDEVVVVVDHAEGPGRDQVEVRWNLLADVVRAGAGSVRATGPGWAGLLAPGPGAVRRPTEDDPASGWHAATYALRRPLEAVVLPVGAGGVVSAFATGAAAGRLDAVVAAAGALDLAALDAGSVDRLVSAAP